MTTTQQYHQIAREGLLLALALCGLPADEQRSALDAFDRHAEWLEAAEAALEVPMMEVAA